MQGLNPAIVIQQSQNANGCAVVTPLPNATGLIRVASKIYLANLNDAQWIGLQAALYTESFVRVRHMS